VLPEKVLPYGSRVVEPMISKDIKKNEKYQKPNIDLLADPYAQ
jgi:hypothetical protein